MEALLDHLQRLLARAAVFLTPVGGSKSKLRPPPARAIEKLSNELLFMHQPNSAVNVLFFRGSELVYQKLYDPIAGRAFANPEVNYRQVEVIRTLLDFMRDTFRGEGNCVGYHIDDWWIMGLVEGQYTLVAMTKATSDPEIIERWLQNLSMKLAA